MSQITKEYEFPASIPAECLVTPVQNKELFICSVCLGAIIEPIINAACQHPVCRVCFDEMTRHMLPRCPICRRGYIGATQYTVMTMPPFIRAMFEQNSYKCPSEVCQFSGTFTGIREHLGQCQHMTVECRLKGCKEKGTRDFIYGEHLAKCEFNLTICLACGGTMRRNQMAGHKCAPNIIQVIGRGKLKQGHFVQAVVEYQTPCFSNEEWSKRRLRGVVKLETIWARRPFADVTWQLADYIMKHPDMVGPNLTEKDGKLAVREGPAPSVPRVACPSKRFKSITGHRRHYEDEGLVEEDEREVGDDDSVYGALEPHPQDGGNRDFFEDDER